MDRQICGYVQTCAWDNTDIVRWVNATSKADPGEREQELRELHHEFDQFLQSQSAHFSLQQWHVRQK
jgi:hypothetical protein